MSAKLYWYKAIELIYAWAKYQRKKKLWANATSKETYHKVKYIIDNFYGGDIKRLVRHKNALSDDVDDKVKSFNEVCAVQGVKPINREWLFHNLKESKDYDSLRKKCTRRYNKNKASEPLEDLI